MHPPLLQPHDVGRREAHRRRVGQQGASAGGSGQLGQDQPDHTHAWPALGHSQSRPEHGRWRRSGSGGGCGPAPATAVTGEVAEGRSVAGGGYWSDVATHCRGGGEGEQGQQQRRLAKLGHGAGSWERGREERERENGEGRGQARARLLQNDTRR